MLQRNSPQFLSSTRIKAASTGKGGQRVPVLWQEWRFPRGECDAAVVGEQLGVDLRLPGDRDVATEHRSLAVRAEATI